MRQRRLALPLLLTLVAGLPTTADAQPLGTFRWQLAPYCNVITVVVTRAGDLYRLDGYDNQCGGGANRAPALGLAVVNPGGGVGMGLTIVTSPGGAPVHLEAQLNLATLNGSWHDSLGEAGLFVFTASATAPGAPRPIVAGRVPDGAVTTPKLADGAVTGVKIDATQVQRRVTGACAAGEAVRAINDTGTVTCESVAAAGGDITGVTAGAGLTGGGTAGDVALAVAFAGPGLSTAAARSDHDHNLGGPLSGNTAVGNRALDSDTPSSNNTAVGYDALRFVTNAGNTAVGAGALRETTNARQNTAVGHDALEANTIGEQNTAVGFAALSALSATAAGSASWNTAVGAQTLDALTTGTNNVAVGRDAGSSLQNGSFNLYLQHPGSAVESHTTRIGFTQSRVFMSGVYGVTTGVSNAQMVVIDAAGQLGTISSSRRTKFDITNLPEPVSAALHRLRPVQFRYRQPFADGSTPIQFGLIAEEVETALPALVVRDAEGQPVSVKYQDLPALLLADVQRLERERRAQDEALQSLRDELAALRRRLEATSTTRPR